MLYLLTKPAVVSRTYFARLHVFCYVYNISITIKPNYVQWELHVEHPDGNNLGVIDNKDHSLIIWQRILKHQTSCSLGVCFSYLYIQSDIVYLYGTLWKFNFGKFRICRNC